MPFPCRVKDRFTHTMPFPCRVKARFTHTMPFPCRVKARFTHIMPRPCHSPASDNKLPGTPRGSRKQPTAGRSLTFSSQAVRMPSACRDPAVKGIFVAWQGNDMVCVNQTRPPCVNQMGKSQSKPLTERHGMGTAWHGNGMAWERHGMCESV